MEEGKNFDQFDQKKFEEAVNESFESEEKGFNETLNQKLIISLYGDVNCGKSNTINALLGKKLAEVRAIAGHTKGVSLYKFNDNVYIADTPGLDDVNVENSKKAVDFIEDDSDVILFFFTASEGSKKSKVEALNNLKKLNKPIIVVLNKIDIWYSDGKLEDQMDHDDVIRQISDETGKVIIPISAKKNINIKSLDSAIINILEKEGKDILYLKISRFKDAPVKNWINAAAATSFTIGLIPIPGADMIPLTALQIGLAIKIGYIHGYTVTKSDVVNLMAVTITGTVGKSLFKLAVQGLKGLGWLGGPFLEGAIAVAAGTIAASVTYGFGWACNAYFKSGMKLNAEELGNIFKEKFEEYKKLKESTEK
jgi:GTP-binding protein Era